MGGGGADRGGGCGCGGGRGSVEKSLYLLVIFAPSLNLLLKVTFFFF